MAAEQQEPRQIVEAALSRHEPPVVVTELRVLVLSEGPRIQGRVASQTEREWAIGVARNALGQEVHDDLVVDAGAAPPPRGRTGLESSEHQAESDAASRPSDRSQVDTDMRRAGASKGQPPASGEGRLEEIRQDEERLSPDLERPPQRPAAPDERPRSY